MIQVDEVLNDPDVCSSFTIVRTTGQFALGGWKKNTAQVIQAYGAVRNTSGKDLQQLPEADRIREAVSFRSVTEMFTTNAENSATSDVLIYQSQSYSVITVKNYKEQGYFLAIAERMKGD